MFMLFMCLSPLCCKKIITELDENVMMILGFSLNDTQEPHTKR